MRYQGIEAGFAEAAGSAVSPEISATESWCALVISDAGVVDSLSAAGRSCLSARRTLVLKETHGRDLLGALTRPGEAPRHALHTKREDRARGSDMLDAGTRKAKAPDFLPSRRQVGVWPLRVHVMIRSYRRGRQVIEGPKFWRGSEFPSTFASR